MYRDEIIDSVRLDVIGPNETDDEVKRYEKLTRDPLIKYLSGIIEPARQAAGGEGEDVDKIFEDALSSSNQSCVGLSFRVENHAELTIQVECASYEKENERYCRQPIVWQGVYNVAQVQERVIDTIHIDDDKKLLMMLLKKDVDGDSMFVCTIYNGMKLEEVRRPKFKECYFQVKGIISTDGIFNDLNKSSKQKKDRQYLNDYLYNDLKRYATGHGCSVAWQNEDKCDKIETTFLPTQMQLNLRHRKLSNEIGEFDYSMEEYMDIDNIEKGIDRLREIPHKYKLWLEAELAEKSGGGEGDEIIRNNRKGVEDIYRRLESGIRVLETNEDCAKSFGLMNRSMLLNQLRSKQEIREFSSQSKYSKIDVSDRSTWPVTKNIGNWRLFQMAFILMNITSLCEEDEGSFNKDDRERFDLIWFPTGGGKTEAYLGLSSFLFFYERMKGKSFPSTSILMRYTLRLLSRQQFERAASLVVACNDILKYETELNAPEVSLGLWVGKSMTPNKRTEAVEGFEEFRRSNRNPFVITKCPRCFTKFERKGEVVNGYRLVTPDEWVEMYCSVCCDAAGLPIYQVDEDIRKFRPSIIVATVDKLATLPWDVRNRSILGVDVPESNSLAPLKLIIQDELHLIDGPLGTVVGLYEMAIDFISEYKDSIRPKRIGSTATISMVENQLLNLYGKGPEDIQLFPQPLRSYKDNFFSYLEPVDTARKYVGLYMNSSPSYKTSQVRLNAALIQFSKNTNMPDDSNEESYQTLVSYFNTLKDLGHSKSMLLDDVPQELKVIHRENELKSEERRYLPQHGIIELTSREDSSEIVKNFDRLLEKIDNREAVDVCLATNMISVGLDISRLSLMLVNRQPKGVAEYIQASSRVGRGSVPGLVFVLYAPNRARDRSVFENFQFFHNTLQMRVEPSSLTPFASQARSRALPGVLFTVMRNCVGSRNRDAPDELDENVFNRFRDFLLERCRKVDELELEDLSLQLELFKENFKHYSCYGSFRPGRQPCIQAFIQYGNDLNVIAQNPHPYPVLTSMRSVDQEKVIEIY